jgi:hypothetical protein
MKYRPILFLDLDGVLNHETFFVENFETRKDATTWHERYFCPKTVKIFNNIIDRVNGRIVFSSSHRFHFDTFAELQEGFKLAGITGELICVTPKLHYSNNSYSVPRGCEIKAWMEDNKDILGDKISRVKYAILDDDTDMLYWQRNHFFCTLGKDGLTQEIADKIIKHLI